jgi:hypothetical protein
MATIVPLSTWLTDNASQFNSQDIVWVTFVKDFKSLILANSVRHTILGDVLNIGQYNIFAYLRSLDPPQPPWLDWLTQEINGFTNDIEFKNITTIYIPSPSYISTLYQRYQTTTALPPQT